MKKIFQSPFGISLFYITAYTVMKHIIGFEGTMIVIGASIMGYVSYNKKKKK